MTAQHPLYADRCSRPMISGGTTATKNLKQDSLEALYLSTVKIANSMTSFRPHPRSQSHLHFARGVLVPIVFFVPAISNIQVLPALT